MATSPKPETTVLTYYAGFETNGLAWSRRSPFRLAVSSFIGAYSNSISIVERAGTTNQLHQLGVVEHYYPPTKLLFSPAAPVAGVDDGLTTDELVTSGDYLRLWKLTDGPAIPAPVDPTAATPTGAGSAVGSAVGSHADQQPSAEESDKSDAPASDPKVERSNQVSVSRSLVHTFKHLPKPGVSEDFCAPVTSFDWNREDPRIVAACSIDTTVSLWDLATQEVSVHLIAHDKEVFDVAFQSRSTHIFATCGADSSVRVFDIRKMEHCTVVYENPQSKPMLRVEWNQQDPNYIAAMSAESNDIVVFDYRYPAATAGLLPGTHTAPLNSFAWAPHSPNVLCSAGEDKRCVIWDTQDTHTARLAGTNSVLSYEAPGPINQVAWNGQHTDWIAISYDQHVQMLHV